MVGKAVYLLSLRYVVELHLQPQAWQFPATQSQIVVYPMDYHLMVQYFETRDHYILPLAAGISDVHV